MISSRNIQVPRQATQARTTHTFRTMKDDGGKHDRPGTTPTTRFVIGSVDDVTINVYAQYNPKELQYDRAVPWTPHQDEDLEFGAPQGRSLSVELFFDGFEDHRSIAPDVDALEQLATMIDGNSMFEAERRPHRCIVVWGDVGIPRLACVIENLSTKYLMFSALGVPLRASCTVKLKEASVLSRAARAAKAKANSGR